jgi:hypothetical protein
MEDPNQILVPESFMALYQQRGRPTRERHEIEARFELCEDLAAHVSQLCATVQFSGDLSESAALKKCFDGLVEPPATVSQPEARWVMSRVAEMLDWPLPAWLNPQP